MRSYMTYELWMPSMVKPVPTMLDPAMARASLGRVFTLSLRPNMAI